MIILAYDIETTGLDKHKDRIIEVGLALYSTGQQKILESTGFLVHPDGVAISQEITDLTGVTQSAVDKFGYDQHFAIDEVIRYAGMADAIMGHNVVRFDMPVTNNTAARLGLKIPEKLIIDTMTDIPGVDGEQLITMCAKKGFCNPNQHSAEDDAKAVIKLTTFYDIDKIVERAKSPTIAVQSHQARSENDLVKKLKFRWYPERKIWYKLIKQEDINALKEKATFDISIIEKGLFEEIRNL